MIKREDYLGTKMCIRTHYQKNVKERNAKANDAKIKLRNSNGKDLKTTIVYHVYNAECNLFVRC